MAIELMAPLCVGSLTVAKLLVSTVAMIFGAFAATSPHRAAEIWGSQRLRNVARERKASFVHWYRIFGIFLFLGGALFAIDSILLSKYHH